MNSTTTPEQNDLRIRNSASKGLRKAAETGDVVAFHEAFIKELSKPAKRLNKLLETSAIAANWSTTAFQTDGDRQLHAVVNAFQTAAHSGKKKATRQAMQQLIEELAAVFADADQQLSPYAMIVSAEVMLRYGESVTPDQLFSMVQKLANNHAESGQTTMLPGTPVADDSICQVIANGECPFILSLLLEFLQTSKLWHGTGVRTLTCALEDSTDNDGTLRAAFAREADQWLAPFVRCAAWAKAFKAEWGTRKSYRRWDFILERAAALATPEGFITQPRTSDFDGGTNPQQSLQVLQLGMELAGFSASSTVRGLMKGLTAPTKERRKERAKQSKKEAGKIRWSEQSDWAECALLRSNTSADADVISVDWDEDFANVSLAALGSRLLGGLWSHQILINGKAHAPAGTWVCTCWFLDKEVAFAELESGSEDGVRHVRHVMLSLLDHFALLTDSVTCPESADTVEFSSELPLAQGVQFETNTISRELNLQSPFVKARAVPTWLEDDRVHQASGNLTVEDGRLVTTATGNGGVTLPLLLDWHPDRARAEADWNRLTVTEERRVQSSRDAAGFRARIGNLQLLLFRSLRPGETLRAVMGLHTQNETVYGRVDKDGDIAPLVLVQSEA